MSAFPAAAAFISARLEKLLPRIEKPGRYVGGELNTIHKKAGAYSVHFALAFPDVYEVGMSNLALAILYDVLNRREDTWAERVFAPWPDAQNRFREAAIPLYSLESRTPLWAFDIVGFSLAFELCYTNVLNMLNLGGVPIHSADRDERHPLVIAGGHCAFTPEPMAPFIDAFVIGEGEDIVHEIVDAYRLQRSCSRRDLLRALAAIPGVYVPALYRVRNLDTGPPEPVDPLAPVRITRRWISDADSLPFPEKPVVPLVEVVHDRISIEVMRGCTRGCRFCQAGMITRPVRERSADKVLQLARQLVASTGHEEVSLVSLSTSDHSEVGDMVSRLIEEFGPCGVGVSLPSLRADQDCVELARQIQTVRKSGLTFAPEAGTQRLRDVINKGVTEADLFRAVDAAFQAGWRHIKLYFMIGLPTETDEDVLAIAELARAVLEIGRKRVGRAVTVAVTVSGFVPKPHTPFQWRAQDSPEELQRKQNLLRSAVRDRAITLKFHDPRVSWVEGVLARGGRRVADAVEMAWRLGARFDAWDEYFSYERWQEAFRWAGVDPELTTGRVRGYHEPLPWDAIDTGVSKAYLRAEDKRAERGQRTPDCHMGPCTMCQACERWLSERQTRSAVGTSLEEVREDGRFR